MTFFFHNWSRLPWLWTDPPFSESKVKGRRKNKKQSLFFHRRLLVILNLFFQISIDQVTQIKAYHLRSMVMDTRLKSCAFIVTIKRIAINIIKSALNPHYQFIWKRLISNVQNNVLISIQTQTRQNRSLGICRMNLQKSQSPGPDFSSEE